MTEDTPIDRCLDEWARSAPQRAFLVGDRVLTFVEAEEAVSVRAARLRETCGGEPIILSARNSTGWVLDALAAIRAGSPLVLIPPDWTEGERSAVAAMAGVRHSLADGDIAVEATIATER